MQCPTQRIQKISKRERHTKFLAEKHAPLSPIGSLPPLLDSKGHLPTFAKLNGGSAQNRTNGILCQSNEPH